MNGVDSCINTSEMVLAHQGQGHHTKGLKSVPQYACTCEYGEEHARVEAWLDEHPEFMRNYFIRKATRQMVDSWLVSRAMPSTAAVLQQSSNIAGPSCDQCPFPPPGLGGGTGASPSRPGSGTTTPVRKISAHEFERGGLLKPMVTTVDGTPTFLSGNAINISNIIGSSNSQSDVVPSSSSPSPAGVGTAGSSARVNNRRRSRTEFRALDERELIFELVKDVYNDLDVRTLCHKILRNVSVLTNADRCSLFLVQGDQSPSTRDRDGRVLVSTLFDVRADSTLEEIERKEEIRIPWGTGIVGFVAQTGEPVNIPDAYADARFNQDIDLMTGYKTRNILCFPIKDSNVEVIGVAQVINKTTCKSEQCFSTSDEKVFASYLQFCGIAIRNAQLYEQSQLENKRNQVLLDLARMIFEEQSTIEHVVYRIMTHTQSLLQCQRCQVMLVDEATKGTFSRVFDLASTDYESDHAPCRAVPFEGRFPVCVGISGHVATTGETINIPDVYEDDRFDVQADLRNQLKTKSILCMPIRNAVGLIVGVIQLVDKLNATPFTKNDENFVEAFAIFCGLGIHNTQMYEKVVKAMAKQRVTLEVLSYHATAPVEEAQKLKNCRVPSSHSLRLHDFRFNDFSLDDDKSLLACVRMFLDLDFIGRFHIDYNVLCRWLLSVKKNYRHVIYHNWRHAFNVAQTMFAIITTTQWWRVLGDLECLALLVACLCHDLDHRGTNNSFQIKASSPLAQLYSTSTMEHHHFDQCLIILNSQDNQILSHLSTEEYSRVIGVLEEAILATDLAIYFKKRGSFFSLVENRSYDWRLEDHRSLLRGMLMTACDVAAIAKPWKIQKMVAELVASEFFEQGDMEKEKLKITPIDMMNRDKKDQLPTMQVSFIDAICLPVYEAFASLSDKLQPLLQGIQRNRTRWQALADERNRKEGNK